MGRKGNWLRNLKKALSPSSKRKKDQKSKLSEKQKHPNSGPTPFVTIANQLSQIEKVKPTCQKNEGHCEVRRVPNSNSTGMASTTAATKCVQTITETQFTRKSREELAVIKIQSVFRGYLARSEIQALRGLLRLKSLMESFVVDRQAMNSIRCMQVFVRVHSQIRLRRLKKLEENHALQKRLLQKHSKELEIFQGGKGWNDSTQSKEQVEAKLQSKHEAAMRRERALAYAFSQQKISRNSSRSMSPLFTEPNNPTWGWSWLERWMAAQQWGEMSSGIASREINKANAQFELSSEKNSSTVSQSESHRYTFKPFSPSSKRRLIAEPKKLKSSSRKKNSFPEIEGFGLTLVVNSPTASRSESHRYTFSSLSTPSPQTSVAGGTKSVRARNNSIPDYDCKSLASIQSNKSHRHSNEGPRSSLWDEESQNRTPILPSYMTLTESSRVKSRLGSPIDMKNNETRARTSFSSSAKKHLLYLPSPAKSRRYYDRLEVDNGLKFE
ncbi:protein IQ-DOMAIN 2 isoform X1 [Cucumis melo]|uniref:Protein IQ-DOMAIN 2 isoform X1 n=1 Tax=Cucumis melo TaxID=3656 RepID=A0A1S3B6V6_CUCME|nr:protein IQ-DOMAIN 2 isoform X1 [Cucumis melo]